MFDDFVGRDDGFGGTGHGFNRFDGTVEDRAGDLLGVFLLFRFRPTDADEDVVADFV